MLVTRPPAFFTFSVIFIFSGAVVLVSSTQSPSIAGTHRSAAINCKMCPSRLKRDGTNCEARSLCSLHMHWLINSKLVTTDDNTRCVVSLSISAMIASENSALWR